MTLSVLVLLTGIGAFYWYDDFPLVGRIAMVVGGLAVAAGLVWFSWYGREFWQFAQASRIELRKVVWPSRDETCRVRLRHCDGVVFLGTRLGSHLADPVHDRPVCLTKSERLCPCDGM